MYFEPKEDEKNEEGEKYHENMTNEDAGEENELSNLVIKNLVNKEIFT